MRLTHSSRQQQRAGEPRRSRFLRVAFLLPVVALLAVAALATVALSVSPAPSQAQVETPTPTPSSLVRVNPASQSVAVGANVVVGVVVDNVIVADGLGAYQFQLSFETSVLSLVSVANGAFLEGTGRVSQCFGPDPDDLTDGIVTFGCATFGATPPGPAGSGVLATVTFATSCDGFSALGIASVNLGEPLGTSILARTQDGSASVGGGGTCPTPTATPTGAPVTPTETPTATPTGPTATPATPTPPVTATPVPQLCGGAPGAAICILPVAQAAVSGDELALQVGVDNVSNLGGYQFDLTFNDLLLTGLDIDAGPFLGSTGRPATCQSLVEPGLVGLTCVTLGASPPGPSGSGILAEIVLRARDGVVGLSSLHLEDVIFVTISSASIPVAASQDGAVTILAAPTQTPTPTLTVPPPTPTGPTATPVPPTPCPTAGCPTAASTPAAPDTPTPTATSAAAATASPTAIATSPPEPGLCDTAVVLVVCILPASQSLALGQDAVVDVAIDNAPEVGAFQVSLAYNPALLSVQDVSAGPFLSSTGRVITCLQPAQAPGFHQFFCNTLGASPAGASGSGVLATFTLRGAAAGLSPLSLQNVVVANIAGFSYPSPETRGASVSVFEPPTPTPASTATATLSPTPCPTSGCPTDVPTAIPSVTPTPTVTLIPSLTPTSAPSPTLTPAPAPLALRIVPASASVDVGDTVAMDIVVEGVTNLGAFQFDLIFNPSIVEVDSIANGPFLGSTGRTVACISLTPAPDTAQFSCNTIGASPPGPDGSAVLATVTVRGLVPGLSPLHISNPFLVSVSGSVLGAPETQDGAVLVTAAGGSGDAAAAPEAGSAASGEAAVFPEPSGATLFLGAAPTIIEEIVSGIPVGNGLGAFEIQVAFDAALVAVEIEEGPFLAGTGRATYCLKAQSKGLARLSCFSTGEVPGPAGSGPLAVLTVSPASGLEIRAAEFNGSETVLAGVSAGLELRDTAGNALPVSGAGDGLLAVRALEGDVNADCAVDLTDRQIITGRLGLTGSSDLYDVIYDLEPALAPNGEIDVNDMQVVYGRTGSTCDAPSPAQEAPVGDPAPPPKPTPTPQPAPADTDGDGCSDAQESGPNAALGGRRNYLNAWDFYDVNGDLVVNVPDDIIRVAAAFGGSLGPRYDPALDRSPPPAPGVDPGDPDANEKWDTGPPDGSINIPTDVLGVAVQFGHSCL